VGPGGGGGGGGGGEARGGRRENGEGKKDGELVRAARARVASYAPA